MPKPGFIELGDRRDAIRMPILHEDRSVLAIDKAAGWMLVPFNWQRTRFNLQAAITSAIRAGYFWSRSRNLKFLQHIHRLDAETTGILLFGKSPGAVETIGDLFETRRMAKRYLAVVEGVPGAPEWTCRAALGSAPNRIGRVVVDEQNGKPSETGFRVIATRGRRTLIEATPVTGRTHQIRVHLQHAGLPIIGDPLYGTGFDRRTVSHEYPMGLRAVELHYLDPFRRTRVHIRADEHRFLKAWGFGPTPGLPGPAPDTAS